MSLPKGLPVGKGIVVEKRIRIIAKVKSDGYEVQYRNAKGKAAWMHVPFLPNAKTPATIGNSCGS